MIGTDHIVYNKNHQLTLTVEIKKLAGMSEKWAAEYRHNIMSQGTYPIAPYFLLATSDKFFLWNAKDNNRLKLTKPTCVVNSTTYLKPYFKDFGTTYNKTSGYILEMVVARWLKTLIYKTYTNKLSLPKCIKELGLDEAIYEGNYYL